MSEPFLGTIMPVAFQFAPQDWQTCQGQSLSTNQYVALYSLLGTTYGGNGTSTFNLPDLQGRALVGQGTLNQGGALQYRAGQTGGAASVTLSTSQVPLAQHTHPIGGDPAGTVAVQGTSLAADSSAPTGTNVLATAQGTYGGDPVDVRIYGPAGGPDTMKTIATGTVSLTGTTVGANAPTQAQPFSPLNPYLAVFYLIAINGLYPTRP